MNNVLLARLASPPIQSPKISIPEVEVKKGEPVLLPELEQELAKIFYNPIPVTTIEPAMNDEIIFGSIFDFVFWYEPLKEKFTPAQNAALETLVQVRNMVDVGCNCTRQIRVAQAHEFFKVFWEQNSKTDMPETVRLAANVNRVVFGNFLIHPYTQNPPS